MGLPIPGHTAYVVQRLGLGPRCHRSAQLVHVPDVELRLGTTCIEKAPATWTPTLGKILRAVVQKATVMAKLCSKQTCKVIKNKI
jgi:hypothetical protein